MNVVHGKISISAAEAYAWAKSEGAEDALRDCAAAAPPIPEVAGDLLRRLDFPVAGASPHAAATGTRGAA